MQYSLKNKWMLSVRGIFLISIGILLFTISKNSTTSMVLLFSMLTFFAGIAGVVFATSNKTDQLKSGWLLVESVADIIFSIVAIYFYRSSTNLTVDFMTAFACFALFFAFLQIIYIFQLCQIEVMQNIKTIVARAAMGIGYGLFGIVLLFSSSLTTTTTALINFIGIGPLLAGIALLVLSVKMFTVKSKTA